MPNTWTILNPTHQTAAKEHINYIQHWNCNNNIWRQTYRSCVLFSLCSCVYWRSSNVQNYKVVNMNGEILEAHESRRHDKWQYWDCLFAQHQVVLLYCNFRCKLLSPLYFAIFQTECCSDKSRSIRFVVLYVGVARGHCVMSCQM